LEAEAFPLGLLFYRAHHIFEMFSKQADGQGEVNIGLTVNMLNLFLMKFETNFFNKANLRYSGIEFFQQIANTYRVVKYADYIMG
jgi:hypothetical protein